jgi:hypothetical protein
LQVFAKSGPAVLLARVGDGEEDEFARVGVAHLDGQPLPHIETGQAGEGGIQRQQSRAGDAQRALMPQKPGFAMAGRAGVAMDIEDRLRHGWSEAAHGCPQQLAAREIHAFSICLVSPFDTAARRSRS